MIRLSKEVCRGFLDLPVVPKQDLSRYHPYLNPDHYSQLNPDWCRYGGPRAIVTREAAAGSAPSIVLRLDHGNESQRTQIIGEMIYFLGEPNADNTNPNLPFHVNSMVWEEQQARRALTGLPLNLIVVY